MPTIEVSLGSDTLTIDKGALAKALKKPKAAIQLVSEPLEAIRGKRMSELSGEFLETAFTVGHEFAWDIKVGASGVLNVKVEPEFGARLILRKAGELLKFESETHPDDQDLPLDPPKPAIVPAGTAYVSLLLKVSLSAAAEAAFDKGPWGVKSNLTTGQQFLLAYHHAVPDTTKVSTALKEMFAAFVLPYEQEKLLELAPLCYSEFEYIGEVEFGVSATVGYSGTLLLGTSKRELAIAKDTDLGKAAFKLKPEFKLGASVDVGYTHVDAFRVVARGLDASRIGLFYFKMDQSTFSAGFTVAAQAKLNAKVDLQGKLKERTQAALEKLVPAGTPKRDLLVAKLQDMPDKLVEKAEKEAQKRIGDLVKSLEKRVGAQLTVGFERISVHTVLIGYELDRTTSAVAAALQGNLRDAVKTPGVEVAVGSFVKDSLTRRTSVGLTLLGFEATSIDEFVNSSELSYEGNGIFRLRFTRGRKSQTKLFGHEKLVETLFTATARAMGEGIIRDQDVRLRITLYQKNEADAANRAASVLAIIAPSAAGTEAARVMKAAVKRTPKGAYKVVCTVAPSAFANLTFTSFESPKKPKPMPHVNDQANYEAFMAAYHDLYSDQDGFLPDAADQYREWARVMQALLSGELTADPVRPNRRSGPGPVGPDKRWPKAGGLAGVAKNTRFAVVSVLEGARSFMNVCEDLSTLLNNLNEADAEDAFAKLLDSMETLAKGMGGTFPVHFTYPALAALCRRMNGQIVNLEAPATDDPRDEYAVRLDIR